MEPLDVNMVDPSVSAPGEELKTETTDDDIDDIESTDESSVDEGHFVPKGLVSRTLPTGLCYDERMRYHAEVSALSAEAVHPEDPRRIYYIYKELCEAGLVVQKGFDLMVDQPLYRIDAREATEEEISEVHTQAEYEFVKSTADMSNDKLIDLAESAAMDSLYFNKLSFFSGKLSAGGAIETCKAVMEKRVKNAIAVIRPPGHHAEPNQPMGFCLFNNTCIASRVCQRLYGEACRKILILDWDVHHGNGCQKAFYEDPNILYISLHVHQNGKFYPSGPEGGMDRCGAGEGEGKNVNIPWDTKGMGDGDYMYAFQHVVMPIANSFNPDFVIVSAGFDAAAGDELGGCNVTPPCYAHMTHMLMSLAGGKIAVCLEGGYNFRAISRSALAVTRTLMGEPPDRLEATSATESAVKVVEEVKRIQSRYWKCMYPRAPVGGIYGGERLHDVIRQYQAQHLYDKYRLTNLHIHREKISKSFDQQVLGSVAYYKKQHLMVLFHDPPDLLMEHDPLVPQQKPHNTWMLDASQAFVEWSIKSHFGVIDVNIPQLITITADPKIDQSMLHSGREVEYSSSTTDIARQEGSKLADYIWDNYIEPYDFNGGIWLVGAGNAFHAVARLISENERVYQRINGVVAFICGNPLRPVSNMAAKNAFIGSWYRDHSKIFVDKDHDVWDRITDGKKISKRYGKLIRSPETILNSMMQKHLSEVWDFIRETGHFEEMDTDESSDRDPNATEPEDETAPPRRSAFSSPPQTRPVTATSTAQSSAALHGVTGSIPGTTSPKGPAQQPSMSPSRFGVMPPRSPAPQQMRNIPQAGIGTPPKRDMTPNPGPPGS